MMSKFKNKHIIILSLCAIMGVFSCDSEEESTSNSTTTNTNFSDDSSSEESHNCFLSESGECIQSFDDVTSISGLGVHPDFVETVERFQEEAAKRGVEVDLTGLDMQYGTPDDSAVGLCYVEAKDIFIDPEFVDGAPLLLAEIVLHELGHCILGRGHTADTSSLMCATCIVGTPWDSQTLDELFGATAL